MIVLVLVGVIGWPLTSIQLRLWRNGAVAAQLVESLHAQFPGAEFRGTASYEREVVYISVVRGLDFDSRPAVERSLRELKSEQRIQPAIWLMFPEFTGEEKDAVKI